MRDYGPVIALCKDGGYYITRCSSVARVHSLVLFCCKQNNLNGRQTCINTGVNKRKNFTRRTLFKYLRKLITHCSQATDLSSSRNQKLLAEQH